MNIQRKEHPQNGFYNFVDKQGKFLFKMKLAKQFDTVEIPGMAEESEFLINENTKTAEIETRKFRRRRELVLITFYEEV